MPPEETNTNTEEIPAEPVSPSEPTAEPASQPGDSAAGDVPPETTNGSTEPESATTLKDSSEQAPLPQDSVTPVEVSKTASAEGFSVSRTAYAESSQPSQDASAGQAGVSMEQLWQRFLEKMKIGKRKKLEKIMGLFDANSKKSHSNGRIVRRDLAISNQNVQKLLHVSDATAERYLNILEKEGRIRQVGKSGRHVYYEKI